MQKWLLASLTILLFTCLYAPDAVLTDKYDEQHRSSIGAPPSLRFPLGADELGRNRLIRLLHAARVSFSFAPAAAAVSVLLALALGTAAGMLGGVSDKLFDVATDLVISLPWLFLLICIRAALPLDASPVALTAITYVSLASVAWAAPARVVRNVVRKLRTEDFLLQAACFGCSGVRSWWIHVAPNLRPVVAAQFWTSIPLFILGEANLGLLGLGVAEPIPSLGGLMRESEGYGRLREQPWLIAPIVLVVLVSLAIWRVCEPNAERTIA
jgi:peptide/nickel transport system permease protein